MNSWSTGLRNHVLNAIRTRLANGVIYILSDAQAANADAALQGTVLGKVTLNAANFSFGAPTNGLNFAAPSGGILVKAPTEVWQFKGLANGIAGWYRFFANDPDDLGQDTDETVIRIDGRIATANAQMTMGDPRVTLNAITTIDSFVLPIPAVFPNL